MLRQIYFVHKMEIVYKRFYGKALNVDAIKAVLPDIYNEAFYKYVNKNGSFDYYKYKISFLGDIDLNLIFIFVTGIFDDVNRINAELLKLKNEFLNLFGETINKNPDFSVINLMDPIIDTIYSNLKPKISLIGFSGVGKTTISKLITAQEIPSKHIPTINGEISTIKIGNLKFSLWDFAGQEQFSFLWSKFIEGSDAALLITDSTIENIEKSKYFLDFIKEEAPYACSVVIGNKQDLSKALKVDDIERILGIKAYSFVAIDPNNREKMIKIIADTLDINPELSPLLKPIYDRDMLIDMAKSSLEKGDFKQTIIYFEQISDICVNIGDDSLAREFYEKSVKMRNFLYETNKGYT